METYLRICLYCGASANYPSYQYCQNWHIAVQNSTELEASVELAVFQIFLFVFFFLICQFQKILQDESEKKSKQAV